MRRTHLLVILSLAVVAGGLFGWSHLASAAGEEPEVTAPVVAPPPNPIVSVVVGTQETEYEQDPFEPTRLRRSTNRVRSLIYVRADGSVETKQVQ